MRRENCFSSIDEKERRITNNDFQSHPIIPECIKKPVVPIFVVLRNFPLDDFDQVFVC